MDEASGLLGIPRPTLYRYLREYSIPSVKKSGRISIPENSFEKIRRARDLHKEGLGTEAVRMRMSGTAESAPDTGEISLKLDRLSRDLEGLKDDPKALEEASSPHALRTILARQSLLMSAVFNLTEMVETLLRSNGQPRRPAVEEIEGPETRLARSRPAGHEIRLSSSSSPRAIRSERTAERGFGSLARRRRRGAVFAAASLIAILAIAALLYATMGGSPPNAAENADLQTDARQTIRVPDLSGLTYPEAETRLDEAGLVLEERDSREGEVVGQNPEPDTDATDGDSVSVTLDNEDEPPGGESPESPGGGGRENGGQSSSGASQYGNDVFEYTE